MARKLLPKVAVARPSPTVMGGGLEGADRLSRELALWNPSRLSPDRLINGSKDMADARGRDSVRNNGWILGASGTQQDTIVGSQFRLNAQPSWQLLSSIDARFTEEWAEEFQTVVEPRFNALADSDDHWLDATRTNTLTGMVRLAIGVHFQTGEVIATAEWIREVLRPYSTAIQFVRSDRLCNPNGESDTRNLRRGIYKDYRGKPVGYSIRLGEKLDPYADDYAYRWVYVPAVKPWGRRQVIHIIEQKDHDQSRGVADMVSVLKQIRMNKRFSEVVLQNAVISAMYAAAIESELPNEAITAALGQSATAAEGFSSMMRMYMGILASYAEGANNIAVDGAVIPHLVPGTKLNMKAFGTPGGLGTDFESSILRHIASGLGLSYEALSRDYSKTNYSSGKLATNQMGQAMAARKRHVADSFAGMVYALQLEEMMAAGDVPLPRGVKRDIFYAPLAKEAFCKAIWIGSGAGQIDELKETQAAILRIRSGLSTHAREASRLGADFRDIVAERGRENRLLKEAGVLVSYDAKPPVETPQGSGDQATDEGRTEKD